MSKYIVLLGNTFAGSHHDFGILKEEIKGSVAWFEDLTVWSDLGYLGIEKRYKIKESKQPHKKPRKSKKNPNPELSQEQKDYNRSVSQKRIFVEHAIGGAKRFRILSGKLRSRCDEFADTVMHLCVGLYNFTLKCRSGDNPLSI